MNERIEINPNVCHGSPVIRGTRVLVSQILGALSGGDSVEAVLEDYPSITSEDISAVFGLFCKIEHGCSGVRHGIAA